MNWILTTVSTLMMFYILILFGCSSSIVESNLKDGGSDKKEDHIEDSIRIKPPNKNIKFNCRLGDTTELSSYDLIDLKCVIQNVSKIDINYLCQSCNGLDYYIVLKPSSLSIMPSIHCNGTWPMIKQLQSGDSIVFDTQILKYKDVKSIDKIGLDFRIVDDFIPFETLMEQPELVQEIYCQETMEKNVIWNKLK